MLSNPGADRTSTPRHGVLIFGWLGKFKQLGDKSKCPDQSDRTMKPREGEDVSVVVKSNRNHAEGPVKYSRSNQIVICVKITRRGVRSWRLCISSHGEEPEFVFKRFLVDADVSRLWTIF